MTLNATTALPDLDNLNKVLIERGLKQRHYKQQISELLSEYWECSDSFCEYEDNQFLLEIVGEFSEVERLLTRMSQPVTLRITNMEAEPFEFHCDEPVFSLANIGEVDVSINLCNDVTSPEWSWIAGHETCWGGGISDLFINSARVTWTTDNKVHLEIKGFSLWRVPCEAISHLIKDFPSLTFSAWSVLANDNDEIGELIEYGVTDDYFAVVESYARPRLCSQEKKLKELVPDNVVSTLWSYTSCTCNDTDDFRDVGIYPDCNVERISDLVLSANNMESNKVVFSDLELVFLDRVNKFIGSVVSNLSF